MTLFNIILFEAAAAPAVIPTCLRANGAGGAGDGAGLSAFSRDRLRLVVGAA